MADSTKTTGSTDREFIHRFNMKVAGNRIPLSGTLDLTRQCNLKCIHCYLGKDCSRSKNDFHEAGTEKWLEIIDEITDAGCLHLLITGGEPLLKKDFLNIYRHAKMNGLLVTVFSNGTCIDDTIIDTFVDLPPQAIEISLYGATEDTFERITGVKGSFQKCIAGIRRLLDHGINLKLKTILMSINRHEFSDIEHYAQELGVKFRFDAALFPCLNGDQSPLDFRIHPEEAVNKEMSNTERRREWQDFYNKMKDSPVSDSLYDCGAGLTAFYIDPHAKMHPCLMAAEPEYDLLHGDFKTGWKEVMPKIISRQKSSDHPCINCKKTSLCGYCPAFFRLENGVEEICSDYLCRIGNERFKAICSYQVEGGI